MSGGGVSSDYDKVELSLDGEEKREYRQRQNMAATQETLDPHRLD